MTHQEAGVTQQEERVIHQKEEVTHQEEGVTHQEAVVTHQKEGVTHLKEGVLHNHTHTHHKTTGKWLACHWMITLINKSLQKKARTFIFKRSALSLSLKAVMSISCS